MVALNSARLVVQAGECIALLGPSGSGKSTLLHVAAGLDVPDEGQVVLAGQDIAKLSASQLARARRRHIGFVFQFFQLLPALTAIENVELPLLLDGERRPRNAAALLLERTGLGDRKDRFPGELSGGEMQRVAIARALIARPPLILADEPTGNLDSATGASILDLLTEQVQAAGSALVLATHDPAAARRADRALLLKDGVLSAPTALDP